MDLAQHRAALGLSLEQCAVALGLSRSSKGWISDIENGKREASVQLALAIERWSEGKIDAASLNRDVAMVRAALPANDTVQHGEAA